MVESERERNLLLGQIRKDSLVFRMSNPQEESLKEDKRGNKEKDTDKVNHHKVLITRKKSKSESENVPPVIVRFDEIKEESEGGSSSSDEVEDQNLLMASQNRGKSKSLVIGDVSSEMSAISLFGVVRGSNQI